MLKSIHSEAHALLCRLLKEERNRAGVTQEQLSNLLSVPQSFISKYEQGERRLDVVEFISVCKALGVSPKELVERLTDNE